METKVCQKCKKEFQEGGYYSNADGIICNECYTKIIDTFWEKLKQKIIEKKQKISSS